MASGSTKAIVAAMIANGGISIAKFVGFAVTGATSMLAEAVHSVADTGNQALLLWGGRAAKKQATSSHPFGYGRERYFWSFVVALVIFTLGSLYALYEGFHKLKHVGDHGLESPWVAIGILAVAIVLECFSFRTAIIESRAVKGDATWWQFIRQSKTPELPVVLLEDLGALVGLILALLGVGLSMITHNPIWDAYGTISIGILLGVIAVVLVIEMKSLLIGEGVDPEREKQIVATVNNNAQVTRLIHMRTMYVGPEELLIGMKVEFKADLSGKALAEAIDNTETEIRQKVPFARLIYIEPDLYHEAKG